ncbi:MAG: tail fiber domain-containing protein [Verrucomicrobiaceae bacterium]|nr:tail fiber domain-containing protein [Verrucomicrobiaceae bacterium]
MKRFLLLLTILPSALLSPASGQVPNLISYQGRVAVGNVNYEGTGQFRFALVNAAGTTVYWSNAADTTPADGVPDAAVSLNVSKGLYSVLLGDTSLTDMAAIPTSAWTNADVRLRVWFNDGVNGNQLLTPDQRLAPTGYLADGSVNSAQLAAGAVGSSQLASGLTLGGTTTGTFSGNLTGNASTATSFTGMLAGDVTGTQGATVISDSTVTGKLITGFSSSAGTVTASDTLLTAINKLHGNDALKAPLDSPTFTGTVSGTFSGNGAALTSLDASNILSGTLAEARLSANVAMRNAANTFTNTLTLPAGTSTIAPLKLQDGVMLTTPVFGAVEFDGTNLFLTNNSSTPTRKALAFTDSIISPSQIANSTIVTAMLADGAITSPKIAPNAITSAKLANNLNLGGTTTGTFSGNLSGNATTATTAGSSTNFTGSLAGDVTGTQSSTAISAATVTGKAITGFSSSAGTVTASDTLLTAINKLDGNLVLKAPLASPTFTGTVSGTFSGNGAALTSLNASNVSSGVLAEARLFPNVAMRNGTNTFSSTQTFSAGTSSIAPLKLQTGVNLTVPQFGAVEFDGTNLFLTNNSGSPTRKTLAFTDSVISPTQISNASITTAMLADGAVIASKLGADVGIWSVNGSHLHRSTGSLGIGTASPLSDIEVSRSGQGASFGATSYSTGSVPLFIGRRASGTDLAPAAAQADSALAVFAGKGHTGTGFATGNAFTNASIAFMAAETFTPTAQGTYMRFYNTPVGSTTSEEQMRLTATGALGIGTTTPGGDLEVSRDGQTTSIAATSFGNFALFTGRTSLGTRSAPTAVTTNYALAMFGGRGHTGTAFGSSSATLSNATITMHAAETFTPTANGTDMRFWTTPIGSTAIAERMRITSAGFVGIGTNNPTARLDVNGNINSTGIFSGNGSALTNLTGANITAASIGSSQLASGLTLGGTTSGTFSGNGSALTALSAANLSGTLPALNGSALTNLSGGNITAASIGTTQLADGVITTAKIADNAITTVKINNSAVTAAKLGADVGLWSVNGSTFYRSSGNLGLGTVSPLSDIEVSRSGSTAAIGATSYSSGSVPLFIGRRASGTDVAPAAAQADSALAVFAGKGHTGSSFPSGNAFTNASIAFMAAEDFTPTAHGTYTRFYTTPIGSTTSTEQMRLTASGNFGIGTTNPGGDLDVSRDGQTTSIVATSFGNASVFTGRTSLGTASAPTAVTANYPLAMFGGRGFTGSGFGSSSTTLSNATITMHAAEAFTPTANGTDMRFWTTPTGSTTIAERMRITSTGLVGIGTPSPAGNFEVYGSGQTTVAVTGIGTTSTLYPTLNLRRARGTTSSPSAVQVNDVLGFYGASGYTSSGSMSSPRAYIAMHAAETFSSTAQGTYLQLATTSIGSATSTPRMIIYPNGDVGIGTTTPNARLEVSNGSIGLQILPGSLNGVADANAVTLEMAGNKTLGIWDDLEVSGNASKPGGGSWASTSDIRLKKNIHELTGSLDRLLKLRSVTFEYKEPEKIGEIEGVRTGFIAQEVEKVFPDWVGEKADGFKYVAPTGFESLAVQALRELRAEKDAEIAKLKAQNAALQKQIDEQKARDKAFEARLASLESNSGPAPKAMKVAMKK